jgi:hypothetical protein
MERILAADHFYPLEIAQPHAWERLYPELRQSGSAQFLHFFSVSLLLHNI